MYATLFRVVAPLLWTQKQDAGPQPRVGAAAAFDSVRGRVVLFAGAVPSASPFADTWEWDGEDWTQVADTGPDARTGHALAFDSGRGRVVLFGGIAADATLRGDTWEWDGENWTKIADTGPDARTGHRLAFDSGRSVTVLFGGTASGSVLRGDTWGWDGSNWTQEQDVGPAARHDYGLAFDGARKQVVLYGGQTVAGVVGDTWTWDGTEWTERGHFGPPACVDVNMVFDGSSILLYGGVASLTDAAAQVFAGTWQWDGQHWTQRQDIGPGQRWGHAMAFDTSRGFTVLYGGASVPPADASVGSHLLGDTWEEQGTPVAPPPPAISITAFNANPPSAAGGQSVTLIVTLSQPAPAGGVTVQISSTIQPPFSGSLSIQPGSATGQTQFVVPTGMPPGITVTFTASLNQQDVEVKFTSS